MATMGSTRRRLWAMALLAALPCARAVAQLPASATAQVPAATQARALASASAQAREPASARRQYHLAAAPLERSLLDIAAGAGMALVYDPQLLDAARSAPVEGAFSASEAITQALRGTGLVLQWSDSSRTLTLRKDADATPLASTTFVTPAAAPLNAASEPWAVVVVSGTRPAIAQPSAEAAPDPQRAPTVAYAVDGRSLERQHIDALADLQQLVPGLNIEGSDLSDIQISIRGVGDGGGEPNIGMASGVAVYLDNVYLARPGMLGGLLNDLASVSVLPGAQGTLFGANATGGVVDLHTRAPTFTPEAALRVAASQRGGQQVRAMWSGPLNADLAGRFTVLHSADEGNVTNLKSGHSLNGATNTVARGQLLYRDGDAFQLRLAADAGHASATPTPVLAATHAIDGTDPLLTHAARLGAALAPAGTVALDDENHVHVNQGGISAEANWSTEAGHRLRAITALRSFSYTPSLADPLGLRLYTASGTAIAQRSWSQELRLDSPAGAPFSYAAGLSWLGQTVHTLAHTHYATGVAGLFYDNPAYDGQDVVRVGSLRDVTLAPFGAATLRLGQRWEIKASARLTYERKSGRFVRLNRAPFDSGALSKDYALPSAGVNLQYRIDAAWRAYAALSYGEKSGGINVSAGGAKKAGADTLFVRPEKTAGVEAGLRGAVAGGALVLGVDLFVTDVRDFQTQAYDSGNLQTYLTNAGAFRSRGVEASARLVGDPHWQIDAAAVYNDARYRDYAQARCPPEVTLAVAAPASCDLTGARVFSTPRLTFNASARYQWHGPGDLAAYAGARYAYRGWKFGTVDDSRFTRVAGYGLLALSAGIGGPVWHGRWDATLWLDNALDKRYFSHLSSADYGAVLGQPGPPRTLGLSLGYQF